MKLHLGALALVLAFAGCGNNSALTTAPATAKPATTAASRPAQTPVLAADCVPSLDTPYGTDPLQKMDIYAPKSAKNLPVLLFVHGGEWSRGDKHDVSTKPKFLNEHGLLFVSTNYRLSPKDTHPAQVDDLAHAIAWVHQHIAEFGGDPDRIVIMGHSAGCHLVTLVSLDSQYLAKFGLKPSAIRGAVAWSGGMYDLVARANGAGMYPPFIKATFGDDAAAQRAASPLTYASAAKDAPPFLIASVDDASSETSRQASDQLLKAINASGGHATAAILQGKSHFTANHELGAPGDTTGQILLDFIAEVTR